MTEAEQKKIFSKNLNRYIAASNKTQKEIADSIGVSPQTFNTWCQGIALPRMGKVQALADYFSIGKTDLIDEKEQPMTTVHSKNGETLGIGYRIKEARERLGLTQTELGKLVGVTGSAITNYEKETSHPKEQIIYKLMEILNVDANYLFQDVVRIKSQANDVTLAEYDVIKKYRTLDEHGKEMVDFTLLKEWERSTASGSNLKVASFKTAADPLESNAAHARTDIELPEDVDTSENDIMDDPNF